MEKKDLVSATFVFPAAGVLPLPPASSSTSLSAVCSRKNVFRNKIEGRE